LYSNNLLLQAKQFDFKKDKYHYDFLVLLSKIYQNYELIIKDAIKVPNDENKIRDILVDDYLSKNILNYSFVKEEQNNLGRVDIFIQEDLTEEKPQFIIECKRLDNKNLDGMEGLNAKYIRNGIQRFLSEHYFLKNNLKTNAMVGFVVAKLDFVKNIESINTLSDKILNNLVDITQSISLEEKNTYKSIYKTYANGEKEFIIYHQMMDFSQNIK